MPHTNLPVQLTSFVGRLRETEEVTRRVSSARLVTLAGASGCGKTRLALQIAVGMGSAYADGVWLVELAPLSNPALVPDLVARTLGVQPLPDQPLIERLLGFVSPRQMLLVLDNCEHLIGAVATLAQTLLSAAPDLSILATSREPLGLAGELVFQTPPLSLPPSLHPHPGTPTPGTVLSAQAAGRYDAVQLFVERAGAVLPDFALTPANSEAVVDICHRLDGIPLAIELASARVSVLTVHQIARRLDDRFAFLVSGQRTTSIPHHSTLRAAIDWSYDLLTSDEQVVLRRLAVFAAGFTLDTVAGICGEDGVAPCGDENRTLELLTSLVHKSLVVANTLGRTEARFTMLESIREYALDKMRQAGEAARLRDRHLDLFLARAEEAAPRLGDAYQQLWLAWLDGEHDNLRAALAWSLEGDRIEAGLRIANALVRYWEIRGHEQEARAWFARLLAQADDRVPVAVRVSAYTLASFFEMFRADAGACMAYARTAVDLAEAGSADPFALAFALAGLASAARAAGDSHTAFSVMERAIPIYRVSAPPLYLGMAILTQGMVAIELGAYDTARTLLEESLELARQDGDAFRIGHTWNIFGDLARCEQNYLEARIAYEKAVTHLRELGAERDMAIMLSSLGHTCLHLGEVEAGQAFFGESLAVHQSQQNVSGMAGALVGFAATAIIRDLPAVGARLLVAAEVHGGTREKLASAATRAEFTHYLALARARFTEVEFQREEAAGRAMSLDQAIAYARRLALAPDATVVVESEPDGLTEREREVAALIAQGKSNGEIADELVLSKRTVEKHISNLLSKLGMTNRAQIVRWAMEHGLTGAARPVFS